MMIMTTVFVSCDSDTVDLSKTLPVTIKPNNTIAPVAVVTSVGVVIGQLLSTEVRLEAVTQRDMSLPEPPINTCHSTFIKQNSMALALILDLLK